MNQTRLIIATALLAMLTIVAFCGCMITGAADIPAADVVGVFTGAEVRPSWRFIVMETRLPAALTAILAGAALSVAGLQLQTLFSNPLAGPSILGVSSGASLGVAVVMLAMGGLAGALGQVAILIGALAGAIIVIAALMGMASVVRSATMVLIVGMLLGYLGSSAISLLNFFATREGVHNYMIWGLGSFSGVTLAQLPLYAALLCVLILVSLLYVKPMNALLLGERYAASAGVDIRRVRAALLLISGALTAVVTAWCGPIAFIGLIVPHIGRLIFRTSNHRVLLPVTILAGGLLGGLCQWISVSPGPLGIIPVNAITPVIGVPLIVYIIIKRRTIAYFN